MQNGAKTVRNQPETVKNDPKTPNAENILDVYLVRRLSRPHHDRNVYFFIPLIGCT